MHSTVHSKIIAKDFRQTHSQETMNNEPVIKLVVYRTSELLIPRIAVK